MTATTAPRKSRRILAPLATLAVAGALVVGSGANFSSTTSNSASVVTTGSLTQTNSQADDAIFNLGNIKPGDTVTGSVTIANSGTLAATYSVTETDGPNTFAQPELLTMVVTEVVDGVASAEPVYSGTFGGMTTEQLGEWLPSETRTFVFEVSLAYSASNDNQEKTAEASYTWNGVQLDGDDHVDDRDVRLDQVAVNPGL